MLAFLKNTITQINVETRQGNAPVVRAQQASTSADPESPKKTPARVDAVTGGTQGISHYFAAQMQVPPPKPDTDNT
jgi:uncharacterized protein (DUF39 family)